MKVDMNDIAVETSEVTLHDMPVGSAGFMVTLIYKVDKC